MAWSENAPLTNGGRDAIFAEIGQSLEDYTAAFIIKDLHDNDLIEDDMYSALMFALLERTGWDAGSAINDDTTEETPSEEPSTEETPVTEQE